MNQFRSANKVMFYTAAVLFAGLSPTFADQKSDKQSDVVDRLFDHRRLIEVEITIQDDNWDKVRIPTRSFLEALQSVKGESPFEYQKADIKIDGVMVKNVGIRKKGFLGSLDTERPSLKVRFDKYVDQKPFGNLDRLTLNNNKQDPSRLSQYLSYKLFNDSGTIACRCNFAKVSVNGRSLGIYSNVESVRPSMLKRRFGGGKGPLFEGTLADFVPKHTERFEPKNKRSNTTALQPIADILAAESLDVAALDATLDVEAFMKFWATESLVGFWDGYSQNQNNFFVYQNPKDSKYYFLPWGLDSCFSYDIPPPMNKISIRSVHHNSVIANRLYHNPATREQYRKTLDQLLEKHWKEEALLADIDRVETLLADHILDSNTKYKSSTNKVRKFISGRRKIVERELKRWPIKTTIGPRVPLTAEQIGKGTAAFKTQWFDAEPATPTKQGDVTFELTMNEKPIKFRNIGAHGHPNRDNNVPDTNGARPPSFSLSGATEPSGKSIILTFGFESAAFKPGKQPVKGFGVVIEGNMAWFIAKAVMNPMSLTFVESTATFEQASMTEGEPIEGKMDLKIMKFVGGKSEPVKWVAE